MKGSEAVCNDEGGTEETAERIETEDDSPDEQRDVVPSVSVSSLDAK